MQRIAVLRAGGLGDLVFALPALEALREAYPAAHITVLCTPAQRAVLASRPGPWSDAVAVPAMRGIHEPPEGASAEVVVDAFFAKMCERGFDLAVQLHGGGANSNPFVRRLGARVTAGSHTPEAAPLDRTIPHPYFHSEAMRWLEVVDLVGGAPRPPVPRLVVTERDRFEGSAALTAPRGGELEVTLHPGAGSPRRRWSVEAFAAVGDRLSEAGARVAVIGADEERPLTAAVVERMRAPAIDLGGRVGMAGLVGLLARAAVHVGNDSGPTHIARAVGTRTVTVFWGPNLITAGPILPIARHHTHVSWQMACEECGRHLMDQQCEHVSSVVGAVPVEEVAASAIQLLADARAERSEPGPTTESRARLTS